MGAVEYLTVLIKQTLHPKWFSMHCNEVLQVCRMDPIYRKQYCNHYGHHLGLRRMMSPSRSGPAWIILSPGDLEGDISGVTGRVFFEILQHHLDQYLIRTSTISIVTGVRGISIFSTMLLLPPFPWSITFIIIITVSYTHLRAHET